MLYRTVILSCALACFLGGATSSAQSTPDPLADSLYNPLDQLQASPKWRVFAAVVTHDHKKLQALLDAGDSPNNFSARQRLPLIMACQVNDLEAVKILVNAGAKIDLFDNREENALIMATAHKQIETVRYLLAHGVEVNVDSPLSGESALFRALRSRSFDLLTLLIEAGANVNLPNRGGDTPLMVASLGDDLEMVSFLRGKGAKFNTPGEEFFCAASHGDVAVLERILAAQPPAPKPPPSHGWLYRALFRRRLEAEKQKPATSVVNQSYGYGIAPLMAAAGRGQTAAVKVILSAGANINAFDSAHDTALMYAIKSGHQSTIFALLDAGADPTINDLAGGSTLLQAATYLDDPEVVRLLIRRGVPLDGASDQIHETPLMAASCFGRIHTVQILLDAHVQVNAQSTEGLTALTEAAIGNQADILKLLLAAGADPSIRDGSGKTALDYAVQQAHPSAIALLQAPQASSTPAAPAK